MLRFFIFSALMGVIFMHPLSAETFPFPDALEKRAHRLNIPISRDVLAISIKDQKMIHFINRKAVYAFDVSTAINGAGQSDMSYQTPIGLHKIAKKIGDGASVNTIFRARVNTGRLWDPNDQHLYKKDLVLSRILWLEGLEHGFNKGRDAQGRLVDSKKRYIYIHGTNQEDLLGSPASMGCIRMGNLSVVKLFERVPEGTLVWIQY